MKKRTMTLLLALVMVLGLAAPAVAAEYTVVKGDTLAKIAKKELGKASRWEEIYEANKATIKDPNKIVVGQKLIIPGDAAPAGQTASATVEGFDGEKVTVTVTADNGKITAVTAVSTGSSSVGAPALTQVPAAMVEKDTVEVEAVSGATGTSTAVIEAARKAMAQLSAQKETMSEEELANWALANGYVKAADYNIATGVDALTSATQTGVGGVSFGCIEWSRELQETAIKEFLKGGSYLGSADFAQDGSGHNYREMYQMATSFNNIPTNTNLELVLNIDSMHLMGLSEANTGKTNQFLRNPNVSISWCKQLRVEEEESGYNYYASYGVTFNGQVKIYTAADLETTAGQDALIELFDTYYPTLATSWPAYYKTFSALTDPAEIRAAKLSYITNVVSSGRSLAYEVVPTDIVITAPLLANLIPQMANALTFTTAHEGEDKYAYDLALSDQFLDALVAYKAAYVSTAEGKAAVEAYHTSGSMSYMFAMLDPMATQFGMPTSLEATLMTNNAAGLRTQTTWTPAQ